MLIPLSEDKGKTLLIKDITMSKTISSFGVTLTLIKMKDGEVLLQTGPLFYLVSRG